MTSKSSWLKGRGAHWVPRLQPLEAHEMTPEQTELLAAGASDGVPSVVDAFYRTMVRYPAGYRRWAAFASKILRRGVLPPRHRELAILRTAWLCQAPYEWGNHVRLAHSIGISAEDIHRVPTGPSDPAWSEMDRALLRAVDELHHLGEIQDEQWEVLASQWDDKQMIEFLMLVGLYHQIGWTLNSLRIPLNDGNRGFEAE
jgi:alkylhydroperoxidase family enzyme